MTYNDQLISVREVARACGRNAETVRRWIWSGKLPAEKLGNQLFIKRSTLDNFCRETLIREYKVEAKPDFFDRAIILQNKIKARSSEPIDATESIREMREERMNQIEKSMH